MTRAKTRTTTWIFLVMFSGVEAFAQITSDPASDGFSIAGLGTFGPSRKLVGFEGLLARSDGQTLSIELADQRVMRFRLDPQTRYLPNGPSGRLSGFRIADFVEVKAETAERGYFLARSVRFVRRPTADEEAELLQSPEVNYREEDNVIESVSIDPERDTRRLSLVSKPSAIPA
jgi:hypothetical protein